MCSEFGSFKGPGVRWSCGLQFGQRVRTMIYAVWFLGGADMHVCYAGIRNNHSLKIDGSQQYLAVPPGRISGSGGPCNR